MLESEKLDRKLVGILKGALTPHIYDYTLEVEYEPKDIKPCSSHVSSVKRVKNPVGYFISVLPYVFFPSVLPALVIVGSFATMSWEAIGRRSSRNIVDFANLYCEASIPTEPCEWPEVVVRDSKSHPGLGTEANSIVIGDGSAPLGSAFNPIVIDVDEGWCRGEAGEPDSDADTEIMTTPEFWDNLIEESYPDPASGGADVEPTSVPARTRPPTYDDPELQVFSKVVTDCPIGRESEDPDREYSRSSGEFL